LERKRGRKKTETNPAIFARVEPAMIWKKPRLCKEEIPSHSFSQYTAIFCLFMLSPF